MGACLGSKAAELIISMPPDLVRSLTVANFGHYKGYSHEDQYEFDETVRPPESEVTDRATTAALLAAIGSSTVRDCHAAWRAAADVLTREVRLIHHGLSLDPMDGVSEEYLKPIRDEVLPKEQTARRALAEAIAQELGHRKRHRRRTGLRQMERE